MTTITELDAATPALAAAPGWRLVDRMLAGYGVVVALLALTRLHQSGMHFVLAAHLALPALAWLVANAPSTSVSRVIRALYPLLLLTALYSAIDIINGYGAAATWDRQIQAVDHAVFGMQPSRDWWRAHPSTFWSALLHSAYLSYYLVVLTPVCVFLVQKRADAVEWYLNGLLATYLVCYLFYLLMPVAGPYYEFARPAGVFVANLPARLVYATLSGGSAYGAAFPSSHVAATVAATLGAWRRSRTLGMILAVPTALLAVGVVYCQMHYVTDSVAGLVLGVLVVTVVTRETRKGQREK